MEGLVRYRNNIRLLFLGKLLQTVMAAVLLWCCFDMDSLVYQLAGAQGTLAGLCGMGGALLPQGIGGLWRFGRALLDEERLQALREKEERKAEQGRVSTQALNLAGHIMGWVWVAGMGIAALFNKTVLWWIIGMTMVGLLVYGACWAYYQEKSL